MRIANDGRAVILTEDVVQGGHNGAYNLRHYTLRTLCYDDGEGNLRMRLYMPRRMPDSIFGQSVQPDGRRYTRMIVEGVKYRFAHTRLMWAYHNVEPIPVGFDIHHRDGNASNDRIGNLVCVTHADNIALRTKLNKNNTSGHTGVSRKREAGRPDRWLAAYRNHKRTCTTKDEAVRQVEIWRMADPARELLDVEVP